MYLSILFLPLLSAVLAGSFGRVLGYKGVHLISVCLLSISAIFTYIAFYEVLLCGSPVILNLGTWFTSEYINIAWEFYFDSLTITMLFTVLTVSSLVHLFSVSYMAQDPHQQRFFAYLSLFTFFMLVLVSGSNYLVLFVGWEGIGITSFLLISFWFTRVKATKSAFNALLTNRVGDLAFSIGFFAILSVIGSLDFASLFSMASVLNPSILGMIGFLFLLGAMAKSAQFGLHNWLPAAMEGPTPVSSLIHAATLVTAGVYLLLRSSPFLEYTTTCLFAISLIGSISCFYAASIGLFQNDVKRIIAFSTMSQVAYMFIAIGLSQYAVGLFHLVNHAFFKALLFLSAGALLHGIMDQQDLRKIGGFLSILPFIYTCFLIGSLSLMAIIGLTGFYSKDFILELAAVTYSFSGSLTYTLGTISAGLTAFYSFRLLSLVFYAEPNANKQAYTNAHDADTYSIISMTILALLALLFGYLTKEVFIGYGNDTFQQALFTLPSANLYDSVEFGLDASWKNLPLIVTICGLTLSIYFYVIIGKTSWLFDIWLFKHCRNIYSFFLSQWYMDHLYAYNITYNLLKLSSILEQTIDKGLLEFLGPNGSTILTSNFNRTIHRFDDSILTSYAILFLLVLVIVISFALYLI